MKGQRGRLDVVASPIGNLGDVTPRLGEALEGAEIIAAEDTRRTGALIAKLGLDRSGARFVSLHKFQEAVLLAELGDALASGARIALISDGGTPCISDPGSRLVAEAHRRGAEVRVIPGPCAVAAALSVSGLPADRFHFAGFLPARKGARRRALDELAPLGMTLVFYEAPHRSIEMLDDAISLLGPRDAVLCRELTKQHEEVLRAPLPEIRRSLAERGEVLGEIVLVVAGADAGDAAGRADDADGDLLDDFRDALAHEEGDLKRAVRRIARARSWTRAETKRRLMRVF